MFNIMAKKYLDLDGLKTFYNKLNVLFNDINSAITNINSYLDFLQSSSVGGSTITNINVNTKLHVVNVSSDQTLALTGGTGGGSVAPAGRDVHIIIKNTATNEVAITMPTGSNNILVCEPVYYIDSGKYLEINVISDGSKAYYRAAEQG